MFVISNCRRYSHERVTCKNDRGSATARFINKHASAVCASRAAIGRILLTCPPKTDPTFMLGLGQGDRLKCHEKATPSNRSSASCEKRKCFSAKVRAWGISAGHSISVSRPITAGGRNTVESARIKCLDAHITTLQHLPWVIWSTKHYATRYHNREAGMLGSGIVPADSVRTGILAKQGNQ